MQKHRYRHVKNGSVHFKTKRVHTYIHADMLLERAHISQLHVHAHMKIHTYCVREMDAAISQLNAHTYENT